MSLDRIVENIIRGAQQRGVFDGLQGRGQPIDLTAYFEIPEETRVAQYLLRNAGMVTIEVELLQEIAHLREQLSSTVHPVEQSAVRKTLDEKVLAFNLMMDRQKRRRGNK